MKKRYILASFCAVSIVLLALSGCTTSGAKMHCPQLASVHKTHSPVFARTNLRPVHSRSASSTSVATATNATSVNKEKEQAAAQKKAGAGLVAAITKKNAAMKVKIPGFLSKTITDDQMEKANEALKKYSNNNVSFSKNEKGKMYMNSSSRKEFFKLMQTLKAASAHPAAMSDEVRDILALVAGICGIVSIAASPIPWFDYISFPTGIAGIVLGVLGLKSDRRHKWALLGIILGAVGIFLAIVFIILWTWLLWGGLVF